MKLWTSPIITSWNSCKNKLFLLNWVNWRTGLAILQAGIFAQKDSFDGVTRTFELALLSRAVIFAKIRQFWWCHSKVSPARTITSWNFTKYSSLDHVTWKFELALLLQGKLFPKIKQFCWPDFKFWTARIITSSDVHKIPQI